MEMQIKCQRQGVLAQSPEPEAHNKVLDSSRSNWNLEMLGFEERGKQWTWKKTSLSKEENQKQTQPTYDAGSRNRAQDTLVEGNGSHHYAAPPPPPPGEGDSLMKQTGMLIGNFEFNP